MYTLCFCLTSSLSIINTYLHHHNSFYCDQEILKNILPSAIIFEQNTIGIPTINKINSETEEIIKIDKKFIFCNIYLELQNYINSITHYLVIFRQYEYTSDYNAYIQFLESFDLCDNNFLEKFNNFAFEYQNYTMINDLVDYEIKFSGFFRAQLIQIPDTNPLKYIKLHEETIGQIINHIMKCITNKYCEEFILIKNEKNILTTITEYNKEKTKLFFTELHIQYVDKLSIINTFFLGDKTINYFTDYIINELK
jgi:hypothetical protein